MPAFLYGQALPPIHYTSFCLDIDFTLPSHTCFPSSYNYNSHTASYIYPLACIPPQIHTACR